MCALSKINKIAYLYAACVLLFFNTGGKFHPVSNFTNFQFSKLHTLTQVVRSYICTLEVEYTMCLLSTSIKLYYITI